MNRRTLRRAFFSSLPVMAGYVVLGTGFGILLCSKGYSLWWGLLMSLTIFAGSMQYVGVDLISSGAGVLSTLLMTLMVNARHLFYGVSMIEPYRDMGWRRWYAIFGLTDETYSLVCSEPMENNPDRKDFCFLVTLLDQGYWVLGTLLGGILGSTLHFNSAGIDFSMTALFVSIVVDQWDKAPSRLPALLGLAVSVCCLLIFGPDSFLIPSMLGISLGLFLLRRRIEGADAKPGRDGESDGKAEGGGA